MSECQALHPDPADISEDSEAEGEEEEEEGAFDDAEEDDMTESDAKTSKNGNNGAADEPMDH